MRLSPLTSLAATIALTAGLLLAPITAQAKAKLVPRATCLSQCGPTIAAQCSKTLTLKNGTTKTKVKPACKAKLIRKCRHNQPVCSTTTTTTPTGPPPPAGTTCPAREPSTLPKQLNLTVPLADATTNSNGSDLDNGISGVSHNFPVIGGNTVKYCLSGCDGTTTTQCTGTGTTGDPASTLNGPTFGAPLPLLAGGVPVCVVSRYQDPTITSTYDLATGQGGGLIKLFSDVYLVQSSQEVCPRCVVPGGGGTLGDQGTCSATARTPGAKCTVQALDRVTQGAGDQNYTLSTSCIPTANLLQASLDIELPLTTEAVNTPGPLPCKSMGQTADDACSGADRKSVV